MLKIAAISDTHSDHLRLKGLPEADMLIHSGDCTHEGTIKEFQEFLEWFKELPYKYKLLTPGNHDFICGSHYGLCNQMTKEAGIHYLLDSEVEIEGIRFYGTPWTPYCGDWAFCIQEEDLAEKFNKIPLDTNVLITHGPAKGILDNNYGSISLARQINRLTKLDLHVFGHIHESYGTKKISHSLAPMRKVTHTPVHANVAMAGTRQHAYRNCASNHKPMLFELESYAD